MENKTLTSNDLESTFTEVRKAYRLLHEYQRRVLDLAKYIGAHFDYNDFNIGSPLFSNPIDRKRILDSDRWAWDFLPGYVHWYSFKEKEIPSKQNIEFAVVVISDTGYYRSNIAIKDKIDLDTFLPVATADTQIALVLFNYGNVDSFLEKLYRADIDKLMFESKEEEGKEKIVIAKKFPLSRMIDEKSTNLCLIEFSDFCVKKEIRLFKNKEENTENK